MNSTIQEPCICGKPTQVCVYLSLVKLQGSVLRCRCFFFFFPWLCFQWTLPQICWRHMTEQTAVTIQKLWLYLKLFRNAEVCWVTGLPDWVHVSASIHYIYWSVTLFYIMSMCHFQLTLLWWIEARLQAVEELIKAQLPVSVLIRELNEGIDTQAPGKHR